MNSLKKASNHHIIILDTVAKASGWKFKVDTPEGVYKEIQEDTKVFVLVILSVSEELYFIGFPCMSLSSFDLSLLMVLCTWASFIYSLFSASF